MKETLMIPFFDPGIEEVNSYPHKIELTDRFIEIWSFANVNYEDDDAGIKRLVKIDEQKLVLKKNVTGVFTYQGVKYQNYGVRIYFAGMEDTDIYFLEKTQARELYNKIKKWILEA